LVIRAELLILFITPKNCTIPKLPKRKPMKLQKGKVEIEKGSDS
jgi:hypothetical protein